MDCHIINEAMERLCVDRGERENFLWPLFPPDEGDPPTGMGWFDYLSEVGESRADDFIESHHGIATQEKAGSLQKISVFCKRVELGQPLFHPGDSKEKEQQVIPKIERSNNNFAYYFTTEVVECLHCMTCFERVRSKVNERRSESDM